MELSKGNGEQDKGMVEVGDNVTLKCKTNPIITVTTDNEPRNVQLSDYPEITEIGKTYVDRMSFPDKNGMMGKHLICESPLIRKKRSDDQRTFTSIILNVFNRNILGSGDKDGKWKQVSSKEYLEKVKVYIQNSEWWETNKHMYLDDGNQVYNKDNVDYIIYAQYDGEIIKINDKLLQVEIYGRSFIDKSEPEQMKIIDTHFPSIESLGEKWNCNPTEYVYSCR